MYIQHISQIWIRFNQYIPCLRILYFFFFFCSSFAYSIAGLEYSIIGSYTHTSRYSGSSICWIDVYIRRGTDVCVVGLRKIPVCITFFKLCFFAQCQFTPNANTYSSSVLFFRSVIVEQRSESEM